MQARFADFSPMCFAQADAASLPGVRPDVARRLAMVAGSTGRACRLVRVRSIPIAAVSTRQIGHDIFLR